MGKKIGAITSLSIIGVLILATIIMACVSCDYRVRCNAPDRVYVQKESTQRVVVDDEMSKTIQDYINNASKQKAISALFNGRLGEKAEIVNETKTLGKPDAFFVTYVYDQPQILQYGNKDYKDSEGNTFKFRELVFEVKSMDAESQVKVYVKPYYDADGEIASGNQYTKYYELQANFGELYNYLTEKF